LISSFGIERSKGRKVFSIFYSYLALDPSLES
jgi:hypothetical protein